MRSLTGLVAATPNPRPSASPRVKTTSARVGHATQSDAVAEGEAGGLAVGQFPALGARTAAAMARAAAAASGTSESPRASHHQPVELSSASHENATSARLPASLTANADPSFALAALERRHLQVLAENEKLFLRNQQLEHQLRQAHERIALLESPGLYLGHERHDERGVVNGHCQSPTRPRDISLTGGLPTARPLLGPLPRGDATVPHNLVADGSPRDDRPWAERWNELREDNAALLSRAAAAAAEGRRRRSPVRSPRPSAPATVSPRQGRRPGPQPLAQNAALTLRGGEASGGDDDDDEDADTRMDLAAFRAFSERFDPRRYDARKLRDRFWSLARPDGTVRHKDAHHAIFLQALSARAPKVLDWLRSYDRDQSGGASTVSNPSSSLRALTPLSLPSQPPHRCTTCPLASRVAFSSAALRLPLTRAPSSHRISLFPPPPDISRSEFQRAVKEAGIPQDHVDVGAIFDGLDDDESGKLTYRELQEKLKPTTMARNKHKLRSSVDQVRAGIRFGKLGTVAPLEPGANVAEQLRTLLAANQGKVMDLFREMDDNGDGRLTPKELRGALKALGRSHVSEPELAELWKTFDTSSDGSITVRELSSALRR